MIKHYVRLVRPVNLGVLALTMLLFRYCIVDVDVLEMYGFKPYLSNVAFWVLLLVTLLVAAGGYVINDIMDVDTDRINRGERLIVEQHIDENKAFQFYKWLTGLAVLGSFLLMGLSKQAKISSIPILVIVLLYLYAQIFKRMALVGNIVVAVCAALPVILIMLYEMKINEFDSSVIILITRGVGLAALFYGLFAFLTTLIREIIKDMEDVEGDMAIDAQTIPIAWGTTAGKVIVVFVQLLTMGLLSFAGLYLLAIRAKWPFYGFIVLLILPLLIQLILVMLAKTPEQFKRAGDLGKWHMLSGVLSMLYFMSGSAPHFFNELVNHIAKWLS